MSTLYTEFKTSKKLLPRVFNLSPLRAGQLQQKVFDSLQLLLIATYPAIVQLASIADQFVSDLIL